MPIRFKLSDVDELFGQAKNAAYACKTAGKGVDYSEISKGGLPFPMTSYKMMIGGNHAEFFLSADFALAREYFEMPRRDFDSKKFSEFKNKMKKNLAGFAEPRKMQFDSSGFEWKIMAPLDEHKYSVIISESSLAIDNGRNYGGCNKISNLASFRKDLDDFCGFITETVGPFYPEGRYLVLSVRPALLKESNKQSEKRNEADETLLMEKPNVGWDEVCGCESATEVLQNLALSIKNPESYTRWGANPPKAVLLYGPPGTGKTLRAKALASAADASFYHVDSSDIINKWLGATEENMAGLFEMAEDNAPAIIFIDEFEQLGRSDDGTHEAIERAVGILREKLDGFDSLGKVMLVGATNRRELINPALLDRMVQIEVPMPNRETRKRIFEVHVKKAEGVAKRKLFGDIDYKRILGYTEDFSGRDIAEVVRKTLESKAVADLNGKSPGEVTTGDLMDALKKHKDSKMEKDRYTEPKESLFS